MMMSRRLPGNLSLASVDLFLLTTRICCSSSFFSFCLNCFCFILAATGDDVVQIFLWFPFLLFPVVFCLLLCCVAVQRIVFFSVHSQFLWLVVCVCVCACAVSDHIIVKSFVASSASCSSNGFILIWAGSLIHQCVASIGSRFGRFPIKQLWT